MAICMSRFDESDFLAGSEISEGGADEGSRVSVSRLSESSWASGECLCFLRVRKILANMLRRWAFGDLMKTLLISMERKSNAQQLAHFPIKR